VVSVTPRPLFTPGSHWLEAGWVTELVWTQRLEEKSCASAEDRTLGVQFVVRHIYWATSAVFIFIIIRIVVQTEKETQKVKCKAVPQQTYGSAGVERRYSSYSFTTSSLDGGEWSASRSGNAKGYPPLKNITSLCDYSVLPETCRAAVRVTRYCAEEQSQVYVSKRRYSAGLERLALSGCGMQWEPRPTGGQSDQPVGYLC
jgi:hypothetical protein